MIHKYEESYTNDFRILKAQEKLERQQTLAKIEMGTEQQMEYNLARIRSFGVNSLQDCVTCMFDNAASQMPT